MSNGIFGSLSGAYLAAAKNTFYYILVAPWLLKPIVLVIAIYYAMALVGVACIFAVFIALDWLAMLTDSIRGYFLRLMEHQSEAIENSLLAFLFRPLLLMVITPFFLLAVFIPKFSSSNALTHLATNELSDMLSGAGAFKKINQIIWKAANNLFVYVVKAPLVLKPIAALVAIFYSIVLICVGAAFFVLIPIDWLSRLISNIRYGIVRFANRQQDSIRHSMFSFLFAPILLIILAPLFLLLILLPKFTTDVDIEV
ncbi:hypothetical protein TI05_12000 [Achromatium sp. WMS3]|nr:hypothetical protein TI03_03830 [Achromatium sp. WMS1]KOR31691.1 hypothetical protein TI05_12000 [Achromatium sp. WMS3]